MSEDLRPQSEPSEPTRTKARANKTPALQESRATSQSVFKQASIKTLRGAIDLLEGVVEKLEAEPVKPRRDIVGNVSTPTGELPAVVVPPETSVEVPADVVTDKPSFPERLRFVGVRFQGWWRAALQNIRSLLPESVNQKLSDLGLTGAIASIAIVLILTTSVLLPGKPVPVSQVPPPAPPTSAIETPLELTAPQAPEPVKIEPSKPVLTPEQSLIAGIQSQVAQITSQYANGLILSIQPNFEDSFLIVKVSDGWYDLDRAQQDNLATEMLRRSQELDFSKFEITDSQGTAIARSPVVGSDIVILKRRVLTANSHSEDI